MVFIWTKQLDSTQMWLITGEAAEKKKHVTESKELKGNKTEQEHQVPRAGKILLMLMS